MRSVLVAVLVAVLLNPGDARAAEPPAGIRVHDGRLLEASGSDLVLRGVNHDFMWYPDKNGSFAGIKAAGANAVRVPFGIGHQWREAKLKDVQTVVDVCRQNRLICI